MLKLFEENGRGQSGQAVALPGRLHSQSGCLLLWTIQQPPCSGTQAREESCLWILRLKVRIRTLFSGDHSQIECAEVLNGDFMCAHTQAEFKRQPWLRVDHVIALKRGGGGERWARAMNLAPRIAKLETAALERENRLSPQKGRRQAANNGLSA
jgi:hypothetical protein